MDPPTSFGLWLKQRRHALNLTQADLAQCAGCSVSAIRKIETDERRPSRQVAELLAHCLDIPLAERPAFLKVARAELRVERLDNLSPAPSLPLPGEHPRSEFKAAALRHNLPTPPTPLIGREHELTSLARLLQNPHCRLLTLVGPGGIGKTRLALEAASNQREVFADGVHFVSLAPISGSEFIVPTIADAIGFTFYGPTDPQTQLRSYLREKAMLLVLDNFEHLLTPPEGGTKGGAELLVDLLQQTPGVKLLVTSRERLNLQGEWVFEIQGLPVPPTDQTDEPESYSAVMLFLQSAQRAQVGFMLAVEERPVVARLCRLVGGMPLGIELAAAWVRTLSCQEIAREIERNLDFLTASVRDVPARHHSIRAVFDHSWQLLSAEEQRVLRQLSVFRGGFRREAAEQVAGASLLTLAGLVDKSLVGLTAGGRYHLHELLRQFSADKLEAALAERAMTHERHSAYFLAFLQEREAGLTGREQRAVLDEIQAEVENVRAAWNWAIEQGQVEAIDRALDSLYQFYWLRSHFQEGEEVFGRAAERFEDLRFTIYDLQLNDSEPKSKIQNRLLARQGAFCTALGRYGLAEELLQNSLGLARRWEAQAEIAFCLNFLGDVVWGQRDYLAADQLYRESLAISQAIGYHLGMAESLWRLGWLISCRGDYLTAQSYLQQGLDLMREIENQAGLAFLLDKLGLNAFCLGAYTGAEQYYQESLALFKEIGDRFGIAMAMGGLGLVVWARGETRLNETKQLIEESLTICREIGHWLHVQTRLALLGHVTNSMGRYEEAQRYFQEAWEVAKQLGHTSDVTWIHGGLGEAALGLGNFQAARNYLLEALETANLIPDLLGVMVGWAMLLKKETDLPIVGMAVGQEAPAKHEQKQLAVEILSLVLNHPATIQVDKDKAGRLLAELEAELPAEVFAAARERGRARTIEEVVAEILDENWQEKSN